MPATIRPLAIAALALLLASPTLGSEDHPDATKPIALAGSTLTWCGDLEQIKADAGEYRDSPVHVGNPPSDKIARWARKKPGFADLWIDRDNLGWITVAFAQDADQRRAELARKFPGIGAVVVEVQYSARQLRKLQRRVGNCVSPVLESWWTGIDPTTNHVSLGVDLLTPEVVELLEKQFAGQPLCVDGRDPSDLIPDGPQPTSGDGWTLVDFRQGPPDTVYRTGVATDAEQLGELWQEAGMVGEAPAVDFGGTVVVWFSEPHGGNCHDLRLDDVLVDLEESLVHPLIVMPDDPMMCNDDIAGAYQFLVALERERLPAGPFRIQLRPDRSYGDATVVEVDLTAPGSTAPDSAIHPAEQEPEPQRSGAIMEPGYRQWYEFDVRCGIGYLGNINDVHWVTEQTELPSEWAEAVDEDGELVVKVLLVEGPDPHAIAKTGGRPVRYEPQREPPPSACAA